MEMNCGKLKKYAFRVTKNRNMASARVRVPGGSLNAKVLSQDQKFAFADGPDPRTQAGEHGRALVGADAGKEGEVIRQDG